VQPGDSVVGIRALYSSNCCTGHEVWVLFDNSVVFRHHPELSGDMAPLLDLARIRGDDSTPWCALVQQALEGAPRDVPQCPSSRGQLRKTVLQFLRGSAIAVPNAIRLASPAAARLLEWGKWHKGTTMLVGGPWTKTGTKM